MEKINNKKKAHNVDKRIIAIYIIVIFSLILGITYALSQTAIPINASTSSIKVAFEATFNTTNLQFSPILDSNVENNENNIIKIDFKVGGSETNPDVDTIYDIALADLKIDEVLKSEYIKWRLLKSNTIIAEGDFKNINNNDRLVLTGTGQDLPDANETPDDYTFYLWFSDSCQSSNLSNCKNSIEQSYMLDKEISGKLVVELNTGSKVNKNILIYFDPNEGKVDNDSLATTYNATYNSLPIPTREGYIFIGWFTSKYKNNPLYYYADTNVEVFQKYGYNEQELYNHYLNIGSKEGKKLSQITEGDIVTLTTDTTLYAGWIPKNLGNIS
jgi:hypothetical protein